MSELIPFEDILHAGGARAIQHCGEFFTGNDPVHRSLQAITAKLEALGIAYAVHDDLAMAVHGREQATDRVEILITAAGCRAASEQLIGRGYEPLTARPGLRDISTGVRIDWHIAGESPGRQSPVTFPIPDSISLVVDGIRCVNLLAFIELKLAAGSPYRLKHWADVQELMKVIHPPRAMADSLHESVRPKFLELWDGLQSEPAEQ